MRIGSSLFKSMMMMMMMMMMIPAIQSEGAFLKIYNVPFGRHPRKSVNRLISLRPTSGIFDDAQLGDSAAAAIRGARVEDQASDL